MRIVTRTIAAVIALSVLAGCGGGSGGKLADAPDPRTPAATDVTTTLPPVTVPPGVTAITSQEAKTRIDAGNVTVIDVRVFDQYKASHIPGAKTYDFSAQDFADQVKPLDHAAAYIIYSNRASRSAKAAIGFQDLGFSNIVEIEGGLQAWVAAGLPTEASS